MVVAAPRKTGGKKAHAEMTIREMMEYLVRRHISDGSDGAGLLTTSPFNATIPLRHDVALTPIGLSGPKGILTGVSSDHSRQL